MSIFLVLHARFVLKFSLLGFLVKKMDTLNVIGLRVSTKIGVHAWEQKIKQTLLIDIVITTDFSECGDDLSKTIDYDALCALVTEFVESRSFCLIEAVANSVASFIKEQFNLTSVMVTVNKPGAVKNVRSIGVMVNR